MKENEDIHNKLIILYIVVVVVLTIFATWVILTRAMPAQAWESSELTTAGAIGDIESLHTNTGATMLDVNEEGKNEFSK